MIFMFSSSEGNSVYYLCVQYDFIRNEGIHMHTGEIGISLDLITSRSIHINSGLGCVLFGLICFNVVFYLTWDFLFWGGGCYILNSWCFEYLLQI